MSSANDVMTDEFCENVDPWCSREDLLDWLLAIGPQGQERLLCQLNGEPRRSGPPEFTGPPRRR